MPELAITLIVFVGLMLLAACLVWYSLGTPARRHQANAEAENLRVAVRELQDAIGESLIPHLDRLNRQLSRWSRRQDPDA